MPTSLPRPDGRALALNLAGAVAAVLALNGLIFGLGWVGASPSATGGRYDLPGWLVGSVWVILFALMGVARWRLDAHPRERAWVTALLVSCLVYPCYALTTRSPYPGLLGNVETIMLAAYVAARAWRVSRPAAYLVLPVIAWVTLATLTIFGDLGWLQLKTALPGNR